MELVDDGGNRDGSPDSIWVDYQSRGQPCVGYYVPGMECKTDSGNTLISLRVTFTTRDQLHRLLDDVFIEVDWEEILSGSGTKQVFNELGFDEIKNVWPATPTTMRTAAARRRLHINSMSVLGPNMVRCRR